MFFLGMFFRGMLCGRYNYQTVLYKSHLFLNIELGPLFAGRGHFLPSISICRQVGTEMSVCSSGRAAERGINTCSQQAFSFFPLYQSITHNPLACEVLAIHSVFVGFQSMAAENILSYSLQGCLARFAADQQSVRRLVVKIIATLLLSQPSLTPVNSDTVHPQLFLIRPANSQS